MTHNTLKSTIESIIAANALLVVTLDGTFNSQTGAPVLSPRTRPDQRNSFLKSFCEKVNPIEAGAAQKELQGAIVTAEQKAFDALEAKDYPGAIAAINSVTTLTEQLDQPRMYYRIKPNVDLRTVAEKRAAKKVENATKRESAKAAKEAKAAEKMAQKVQSQTPATPAAAAAPVTANAAKGGKKAA